MGITMTDEQERDSRATDYGYSVWKEVDATRAALAQAERERVEARRDRDYETERANAFGEDRMALAAREAECAEWRQVSEAMRIAVSEGHPHAEWRAAAEQFIALLSRPPGTDAALRAMMLQLAGMAWADLAPGREVDVALAEAWIARLLEPPAEARDGGAM